MAKLTFNTAVPPVNRRHGIVYYTNQGISVARSVSVPIQPKSLGQNRAQVNLSQCVYAWQQLSPGDQLDWARAAADGSNGYAYFLQTNTFWLTWGYEIVPYPYGWVVYGGGLDARGYIETGTDRIKVDITAPPAPLGSTYWGCGIYIQLSSLAPQLSFDTPDTPIIGAAPASGYVWLQRFEIEGNYVLNTLDITDTLTALYGQTPNISSYNPTTGQVYGSYIDIAVALWDGFNRIFELESGTPPVYQYPPFPNPST